MQLSQYVPAPRLIARSRLISGILSVRQLRLATLRKLRREVQDFANLRATRRQAPSKAEQAFSVLRFGFADC